MDENLQRRLRDLGRAVFEAISESPDVNQALSQIRAHGYTLSMQLNCKKESEAGGSDSSSDSSSELQPKALPAAEPVFRIDGQDLTFLRSIGIDPTRRMRRRR